MTKILIGSALLLLWAGLSHCQDLPKAPSFEVASITPCKPGTPAPPGEHAGTVQFTFAGGRFQANATSLRFLIEWAYDIQPSQHSEGPAWMGEDRYDIIAKADGEATNSQMKLMVQSLLAERFKLKLHREKRELPVYVISLGKTAPKLFPPKDGETHAIGATPQMGPDQKIISYRVSATRFSLMQLADVFARQLDRPIVNETGLDGEFDFTFELTPDATRTSFMEPTLLMTAMREQLGLTLKSQKTPVDFLVIESAEKVAAGN